MVILSGGNRSIFDYVEAGGKFIATVRDTDGLHTPCSSFMLDNKPINKFVVEGES